MIEERLTSYAERWRAAQPPPPAVPAPRRPRAWIPVTAVAAAVAGILAFAAVAVRDPRDPVARPTVVPWKPIPQGSYWTGPLPRDCAPADVRYRANLSGPGITAYGALLVTSVAAESCALRDVTMELRSGGRVGLDVANVGGGDRRPALLAAGETARVGIRWVAPYCGPQLDALVLDVRLGAAAPAPVPVDWNRRAPDCVGGRRRSLFRYDQPRGGSKTSRQLQLRVEAPAEVRANEVLRYRLVLRNGTDRDVPLGDCPDYDHELKPRGSDDRNDPRSGRLHCELAPASVPPGGSVAFEMELPLGDLPEGEYDLHSFATVAPGPGDTVPIVVTPVRVRGWVEPDVRPCDAGAYALVRPEAPAPGTFGLVMVTFGVYNVSSATCDLAAAPEITLVGPDGAVIVRPAVASRPTGVLRPGDYRTVKVLWRSHCGAHAYDYSVELTVAGRPGRVLGAVEGADSPDCAPGSPQAATLEWVE